MRALHERGKASAARRAAPRRRLHDRREVQVRVRGPCPVLPAGPGCRPPGPPALGHGDLAAQDAGGQAPLDGRQMAGKYKAVIATPAGPRKCLQVVIERDRGRKPLVARFGGIPLHRVRTAVLTDQRPVMASAKRNELIHRLLARAANSARARRALRSTTSASSQTSTSQDDGRNPPGCTSWLGDGARPWSSAAAATRTSTLAGQPRPTQNDHWRAGCEETRKPCSGRDRRKRTRPRAPRRRSTSLGGRLRGKGPYPPKADTGPRRAAHPVHESPATTRTYLHADMALKEKAIAPTSPPDTQATRYKAPGNLLTFLDQL